MAVVAPSLTPEYEGIPRIIDATGQQVLLRGVTIAESAAATLYDGVPAIGANFVRVPVYWSKAEPVAPSGSGIAWDTYVHTYSATYLDAIETQVQFYQQNHLYVEIFADFPGWSPAAPFNGVGGIPAWFYTDARFPGVTDLSSCANNTACAEGKWWTRWQTDPGNFTADQYFFAQLWLELIRRFSAYDNVVMYGIWNEVANGTIAGTWATKMDAIHGWLSWVVTQMQGADAQRMKAVGAASDMLGWGSSKWTAFGGTNGMQRQHMVLDFHEYYSGKPPGYPADPTITGQIGLDQAGDTLVGGFAATHTMVSGASYAGALANHENLLSVPRQVARTIGLPLMLGEMGVYNGDPGRLTYVQHMQQLMDAHALSGATVLYRDTGTSTTSSGLVTSGVLNDVGTAWQTWFQNTDFVGGIGSSATGGAGLSTVPATQATTPDFYHAGFNGTTDTRTGKVNDVLELNGIVYVAGDFNTVRDVDGTVLTNVSYLCAYRADTGAVMRAWQSGIDGTVQRIVPGPLANAIYVFGAFNNAGGAARQSMAAFNTLNGATDTSAANLRTHPSLAVDNTIFDAIVDTQNGDAWITGAFLNVGGIARRGVAKFSIDTTTSVWSVDTAFDAAVPGFVGGGGGRALALKPDRTKLVVGWFPGSVGTDVGSVPSLTAYNPHTGAAMAWTNKVYYNNPGDPHIGVNALASDPNGVYVAGLWNGGDSLVYLDWNGGGPNAVTFAAGVSPITPGTPDTVAAARWYWGFDDQVQAVVLGRISDQPVVFVGHRGQHVATAPNRAATSSDTPNQGLATLDQSSTTPGLFGYGGPPNFTTPVTSTGAATGVDHKVLAIYQTPGVGDLIVGGDFTAVNGSAPNTYRRNARFNAVASPTAWNPAPSLSDATPTQGESITVDIGVPPPFTGTPAFQWQRSATGATGTWTAITGATAATYIVDPAGADNNTFLRAKVTVTLQAGGTQTAFAKSSSAVTPSGSAPVLTGAQPQINPSTGLTTGQLLAVTTSPADWTPSSGITFTYQWFRLRNGTATPVGTGNAYMTTTQDAGAQLYVTVTATDTTGQVGTAKSNTVSIGTLSGTGSVFFFSDAGSGADAQQIANLIPDTADAIIYGGDVYPRDTTADYAADITGLLTPAKIALLVQLCGNHDWPNRSCGGGYYAQVAALTQHAAFQGTKDYGKLTIAGWDFIFINTNRAAQAVVGDCSETTPIVDDTQAGLDATELAQLGTWLNAAGTQKVVIGHHMRWSPSLTHLDNPQLDAMWRALQGKCVAYIHGHAHNYSRQRPRDATGLVATDVGFTGPGVVDICAGIGGEGNYDQNTAYPAKYVAFFRGATTAPQYGFLRFTPTGTQITIDAFDEDGVTIFDTITLTATGGAAPTGGIPSLSDTSPTQGETITCDSGQWQGSTPMTFVFTFQHSSDSGATWQTATGVGATQTIQSVNGQASAQYTVDTNDVGLVVRCRLTVTNSLGTTPGATPISSTVTPSTGGGGSLGEPTIQTQPVVTPSAPFVGVLVATTTGTWITPQADPVTSYAFQWYHWSLAGGYEPISGATAQTYTVQPSDAGFALAAGVIASNTAGPSAEARTVPTSTVTAQGVFVSEQIDTPDNQIIAFGQPFPVTWEAVTNAPGGVLQSQIRVDGGSWINGTKVSDDGAGRTVWTYTFTNLTQGTHVIETQDIVST